MLRSNQWSSCSEKNPHVVLKWQRDSPKLNIFCAISRRKVYGHFIFGEPTVTGLPILKLYNRDEQTFPGKIGSRVGRNQTTVMRICDRWIQDCTMDRRGRLHPPQCNTSREDRQIVRMAVTDRSVTSRTIAQHIESSGLFARRPLLGLPLTQNHRRLRSQWCDERGCGWQNGMKLSLLTSHASVCNTMMVGFEWRHRGERMLNSCVMHRHTGPAPGNVKPVEIHPQLVEIYGGNVMSDGMVRNWVRQLNDRLTNVHDEYSILFVCATKVRLSKQQDEDHERYAAQRYPTHVQSVTYPANTQAKEEAVPAANQDRI
ncbi:transposable element Tcb1 transposase [Trichonephila clavipes]|nr:transposable element Tcb1 transposase [Trichonephila clavipes]